MNCGNCKYAELDLGVWKEHKHFGTPLRYECLATSGCVCKKEEVAEVIAENLIPLGFRVYDFNDFGRKPVVSTIEGEEAFEVLQNLKDGEVVECNNHYLILKNKNFGVYKWFSRDKENHYYKFLFQTSSEPSRKGTNEIEYVDFKKEIIEEIDTFNERGRKQIIGGKLWKT